MRTALIATLAQLLVPSAALAAPSWPGLAVVVRGASAAPARFPPLLVLPRGGELDGGDIALSFARLQAGDHEVLVYDVAEGEASRLPPADLAAVDVADALLWDDEAALAVRVHAVSLEALLDAPGAVVILGASQDRDTDGVPDARDLCLRTLDARQTDADGDGAGDACDVCPAVADPAQADTNDDGLGDACEEGLQWLAHEQRPAAWSVAAGAAARVRIAGPLDPRPSACLAVQRLGGRPALRVDASTRSVHLDFEGPPPASCRARGGAVAGLALELDLDHGGWTFRSEAVEEPLPFTVPEPALPMQAGAAAAALLGLRLLSRPRRS